MKILILLVGILGLNLAKADDYHIIDLKEMYIDYLNFSVLNPNARNPLVYPDYPKEAINVAIKLDLVKYLYFDSIIEGLTTDAQYRAVGLQVRLGARITDNLELGLYHHSQHALDRSFPLLPTNFLVEDGVNLRIYLYKNQNRPSIF